jgi:hypothetical protein
MKYATIVLSALFGAMLATAHPGHGLPSAFDGELLETRKAKNVTTGKIAKNNNTIYAEDHIPNLKGNNPCVCVPNPACNSNLNSASLCACKQNNMEACFKNNTACPEPKKKTCPTAVTALPTASVKPAAPA